MDGSLLDGDIELFARAGWSMFIAPGHPANYYQKLQSDVQRIFRAELRAVVQVCKHVVVPTCIYSDCKGVVKIVQSPLEFGTFNPQHEDVDLLTYLAQLLADGGANIAIKWIPGHLDEATNHKKLRQYLDGGGTQAQVNGNLEADALAKKGANLHVVNQTRLYLANA